MRPCPRCNQPQKQLLTSWYCDCEEKLAPTVQPCAHEIIALDSMTCARCGLGGERFWDAVGMRIEIN